MMKIAVLASLAVSAAAFAPTSQVCFVGRMQGTDVRLHGFYHPCICSRKYAHALVFASLLGCV